jgi:hypothetical protein
MKKWHTNDILVTFEFSFAILNRKSKIVNRNF